jgi:hypothetical protein
MLGGPTSPTAPGTKEWGATTDWRRPHVAPAANRATTWNRLHHHQHRDVETSPSSSTRPEGSTYRRGNRVQPPGPLSLSRVPQVLPLVYKRESRAPHLGILFLDHSEAHHDLRRTSTPVHPHQRLGSSSLSRLFITPTTNSSASNTNSSPLDIGTFRPNQYTSSCPLCTPSESRRIIHKFY